MRSLCCLLRAMLVKTCWALAMALGQLSCEDLGCMTALHALCGHPVAGLIATLPLSCPATHQ